MRPLMRLIGFAFALVGLTIWSVRACSAPAGESTATRSGVLELRLTT